MRTTPRTRVPSYRHHKATGQARVTIEGRDHYLGEFGSPESQAKYRRLVAEYLTAGKVEPTARPDRHRPASRYHVGNLCDEFNRWAQRNYGGPNGEQTHTIGNVRQAMRNLFDLCADMDAAEFGPKALLLLRDELVRSGLTELLQHGYISKVPDGFVVVAVPIGSPPHVKRRDDPEQHPTVSQS